ncbi:hypothetical protein NB636_01145 [Oxalobacter aliiformigenes]|uniref:hypothetical protein n=1 Tax=Oxalobacter aliiformigenes TaxID=2946593 RepID=UPI0022AF26D9|nr:hypothetical protein [Oxalobacter aliiformigenes]MCZ4064121.1 hypothetical protein [Oxalobacter aliiformigenes]WAV99497.1 hypothetical protein NB636_01145 [Oxalobacter aliiformigenes]
MIEKLPHDPEAAHALLLQKVNEHTKGLEEVREENRRQNEKLAEISTKLDRVDRNTEGIVEVVHFSRNLCRLFKIIGKVVCWGAGVAGALAGLCQLYITYGGH